MDKGVKLHELQGRHRASGVYLEGPKGLFESVVHRANHVKLQQTPIKLVTWVPWGLEQEPSTAQTHRMHVCTWLRSQTRSLGQGPEVGGWELSVPPGPGTGRARPGAGEAEAPRARKASDSVPGAGVPSALEPNTLASSHFHINHIPSKASQLDFLMFPNFSAPQQSCQWFNQNAVSRGELGPAASASAAARRGSWSSALGSPKRPGKPEGRRAHPDSCSCVLWSLGLAFHLHPERCLVQVKRGNRKM